MKRDVSLWQFCGFAFSALGGTLLHFLYELTDESVLAAPFSGVNESTWEHMKLLFWPTFVFALFQSHFFKKYENFWCVKLAGTMTGLALIPVLFYTYNGAFGKSPDWVNIAIFFISAALLFILETRMLKKGSLRCASSRLCFVLFSIIGAAFVVFTFLPPQIPLFLDPITGTYGIKI